MSDYEAFPLVKIVNIFPEKNLLFVRQMDGRIASFSVSGECQVIKNQTYLL